MIEPRIIVEGMDSTGKTTLIEHLRSQFHQLDLVVNELRDKQNFDRWWAYHLFQHKAPYVSIHDRFFYSELVYGPEIRGKINADPDTVMAVQNALRQTALLIYCRPGAGSIQETITSREQMEGVLEHQQGLIARYDALMYQEALWYGPRYFKYDWEAASGNPKKEVTELVDRYLNGDPQ